MSASQKPDATRVAGLYAWNQLGRKVKKGEKGIRILAPMIGTRKKKDTERSADPTVTHKPVLVGFRSAYVFDVSQTEGAELPQFSSKVTGTVGEYLERLIDFLTAQGIALEFKDSIAPALGMSYGGGIATTHNIGRLPKSWRDSTTPVSGSQRLGMNTLEDQDDCGIILAFSDLEARLQAISIGTHQWTLHPDREVGPFDRKMTSVSVWYSNPGLTDMPNQICYRFPAYPQALGGVPDLLVCLHPSLIDPVVEGLYFEDDRLLADPLEDFGAFWPPLREILWPTSKR